MATKCTCVRGGYLVGAQHTLPVDPAEFAPSFSLIPVGCNRLYCLDCNQQVRSVVGRRVAWGTTTGGLRAIYSSDDFGDAGVDNAQKTLRLYVCHCRFHHEYDWAIVSEPRDLAMEDAGPNWACASHPTSSLPLSVGDLRLDGQSDLKSILRALLAGDSPLVAWQRLYNRVAQTSLRSKVGQAMAALAASTDATTALLAEDFLRKNRPIATEFAPQFC